MQQIKDTGMKMKEIENEVGKSNNCCLVKDIENTHTMRQII